MEVKFLNNPFIVGKYVSDKYFCDRSEETAFLKKQIKNGRNVALISPRRIGKSGLIQHLFQQEDIKSDYYTFFVDIYATTSFNELVYVLGKQIYEQLKPQTTQWKERVFKTIASFRIGSKLDPITGAPTFDMGIGDIQSPQTSLDEIFSYLDEADKPCVIAIDEFQQIQDYAEANVEAMLRTKIQQCTNAQFIFSGSKRHMMSQMFNSPSKPFYQSAISMTLGTLPQDVYADFAVRLFEEGGKHLEREVAETVWKQNEGVTWFVQMLMNELYALTPVGETCRKQQIDKAFSNVILAQEGSYRELLSGIPPKQKIILQAIAKEGTAVNVTSSTFIKKYNLNSASSVQAAIKSLLKNDLITCNDGCYRLYDYFLSQWLASVY